MISATVDGMEVGRKSLIFQGILPRRVRLSEWSRRGGDCRGRYHRVFRGGEGPSPLRHTVAGPGFAVFRQFLGDNEIEVRPIKLATVTFKESGELESLKIQGGNLPAEVAGEIVSSGWDGAQGRF